MPGGTSWAKRQTAPEDIWGISEGKDYPRFVWQLWAFSPDPDDGAIDVIQTPTLGWRVEARASQHDVYFGDDEKVVADATPATPGVYRGRQPAAMTTYDPGVLEWGKTYYWRIDEVNEADPSSPWKGNVWSFTTADSIVVAVVDDFESYTDDWSCRTSHLRTWIDGWWLRLVGNWHGRRRMVSIRRADDRARRQAVHADGLQQREASRGIRRPSGPGRRRRIGRLTGADTLTLYFRGEADNSPRAAVCGD